MTLAIASPSPLTTATPSITLHFERNCKSATLRIKSFQGVSVGQVRSLVVQVPIIQANIKFMPPSGTRIQEPILLSDRTVGTLTLDGSTFVLTIAGGTLGQAATGTLLGNDIVVGYTVPPTDPAAGACTQGNGCQTCQ